MQTNGPRLRKCPTAVPGMPGGSPRKKLIGMFIFLLVLLRLLSSSPVLHHPREERRENSAQLIRTNPPSATRNDASAAIFFSVYDSIVNFSFFFFTFLRYLKNIYVFRIEEDMRDPLIGNTLRSVYSTRESIILLPIRKD